MKRFIALSAATLAAFQANAADLPGRAAPIIVPPPAYSWTGFYIGAQMGYVRPDRGRVAFPSTDTGAGGYTSGQQNNAFPTTAKLDDGGFAGGGQVGYNLQFNQIVAGVEADAVATSLHERQTFRLPGSATFSPADTTIGRGQDYVGTARGRLGYAFDNVLLYVTGGFAYGETSLQLSTSGPPFNPPLMTSATSRKTLTGTVCGGGIEYALDARWSVKAEYLHYDLGRQSVSNFYQYGANSTTLTARIRNDGHLARVGLNYKFSLF